MGRITFPLPPKTLRANRRSGVHWGAVQAAKTAYKAECELIIGSQKWGPLSDAVVPLAVVAYVGHGDRLPDLSDLGFWCKTCLDSLVQCGVFRDDSARWLRPFYADAERDNGNPRLEILWADDARERMR